MENQTPELAAPSSILSDLAQAGFAVQLLLLVLIGLSIYCWAVIIRKWKQMKRLEEDNRRFLDLFWSAGTLEQVHAKADQHNDSSLSRIFTMGFNELSKIQQTNMVNEKVMNFGMDNLEGALRKGQDQEIESLEERLSLLATTGSTAPFIGLLGTVIGIMNSFRDIYNAGSASLATVAPGISEALFATAIGLFAAIPAVVAYNYLLGNVRKHEGSMNEFITDFLNHARLEFMRRP